MYEILIYDNYYNYNYNYYISLSTLLFITHSSSLLHPVGKIDAFIQINFASNTKDTAVIREDLNPVWNQEVRLPVYVPCLTDRIAVRLMDWERVGSSRAIATSNFRWSSVVVDHFGPAWVNKYWNIIFIVLILWNINLICFAILLQLNINLICFIILILWNINLI